MNRPRAHRLAAVAALACLAGAGCRNEPPKRAAPAPIETPKGADRLLPEEIPEGNVRALGMMLPRAMRVERYFNDSVVAKGRIAPEPIANYIRQRVEGSTVEIGVARTVFNNAHVKGQPPDKRVRVEVVFDDIETVLMVRDITPPPLERGLSEDELWRRTGITKDGKIIDPSQMQ